MSDQASAVAFGRPSKYKPEYCAAVEELGKQGKSQEQIAASLDVDPATLRYWADSFPDFSLALTRAKNFEQCWWEDIGQVALFAEKFNSAVWSKSVSSRFKDKYTDRQEQTGKDGGPIKYDGVTRIERAIVNAPN